MTKRAACTACVLVALALPAQAFAHAGTSAPVATNFVARITAFRPPTGAVEARTVDGDQALWFRVAPAAQVLVPGVEGEPLLRFDERGVWVNLHSLTAQIDGIDKLDLRPRANPRAAPLWHRVTSGHAYRWHEHRLHLLEPLRRPRAVWSVPVRIDGRRSTLAGVLRYRRPPPWWLWLGSACVLAVAGAAAAVWRERRLTVPAAVAATVLVWAVRIPREVYGRPFVGVVGWLEVALTSVVGVALLYGLSRRNDEVRLFVAFLVGMGALYQGATMAPVLTHAVALTLLPTVVAQGGVALTLVCGATALAGGLAAQIRGYETVRSDRSTSAAVNGHMNSARS